MLQIVIIEKNGTCSTETLKKKINTIELLYKKCKFRKSSDFEKRATWKFGSEWVSIYARDTGRAGGENKYELPPPIDKNLYFGKMVIIKHSAELPTNITLLDFTKEDWGKVYEKCMGGFEDLGDDETEEEEEEIPEQFKTAQGYSKEDGFVVDDEEEEEEDEDFIPDDEDADDVEYGGGTEDDDEDDEEDKDDDEEDDDDDEMEGGSELSEEDYDYK